jgi:signal transduction histidine kinase
MSQEPEAHDYNLRILASLAHWIEDTVGVEALEGVAASAGLSRDDFLGSSVRWASHAQVEKILEGTLALAGDEETFHRVFAHRFEEGYGAFRYMVWAVSQERVFQLAVSMTNKVLITVGQFDMLYSRRNAFGVRYTSQRPESRLMCISRQSAWTASPILRGLPPAELIEHACIAKGDPFCEYHLRWFDEHSIAPVVVGLVAGVAAAVGASWVEPSVVSAVALPLLGATIGYVRELRRAGKINVETAQGNGTAMRALGEAEAETRSEIVALQQRQQEWSSRLEHQQHSRESSLRGFSHDLRNPLYVVRANAELLRERLPNALDLEIVDDIDSASGQIESMLGKLMDVATTETGLVKLAPRSVKVAPLANTLRRRLKALVHGRGIEIDVVTNSSAPEEIVVDPLVFDRVVDNLLTNAAKYTDRGRIRLVIGGRGDDANIEQRALILELSDTGRGIPAEQMSAIFRPRPAHEPRDRNSYGIGLSSAVRLLGQIGGTLEVRSELGVGSTFEACFPTVAPEQTRAATDEQQDKMISRVVRVVRKAS